MSVKVHEPVCEDSAQDLYFWFDHFLGDQLKDEWRDAGTGSAVVVDAQTGGIVRITTGALDTNSHYMDWQNIRSLLVSKKLTMEIRLKLESTTNMGGWAYLYFDGNDRFNWRKAVGDVNWHFEHRAAGAGTPYDTGIAATTNYVILRVEAHTHGGTHLHWYIDGVECNNSPEATEITALHLQPRLYVITNENVAHYMDIDYVVVRQER